VVLLVNELYGVIPMKMGIHSLFIRFFRWNDIKNLASKPIIQVVELDKFLNRIINGDSLHLEDFYQIASKETEENVVDPFLFSLNDGQREWLNSIIDNAESFKAVLTVFTTSLTYRKVGRIIK